MLNFSFLKSRKSYSLALHIVTTWWWIQSYNFIWKFLHLHLLKSNPVIDKDLLSQKRLQLCGEELGEGADVVEHLQQVLQPLAEALKDAEDVLLAEVELAHLALHLPVSRLDVSTPRWQVSQRKIFKVFISNPEKWKPVVVFQLDAMSQLLLNSLHVLIPDRVLVVRKHGIFLL